MLHSFQYLGGIFPKCLLNARVDFLEHSVSGSLGKTETSMTFQEALGTFYRERKSSIAVQENCARQLVETLA